MSEGLFDAGAASGAGETFAQQGKHLAIGSTRGTAASLYNFLPEKVIEPLWRDIQLAVKELAPGGIMFSAGVRLSGLQLIH